MAQTIGGKSTNANEEDNSPTKEVTTTKVGTKTGLDVNLTSGDIQIGAVEIKDGVTDVRQTVKTDGTDNAAVIQANVLPLPTDAATSAKQLPNDHDVTVSNMIPAVETGLATSAKQDNILTELEKKADLTETQPVSITSLPLPSGGATSANQDLLLETKVDSNEGDNIRTSNVNTEQTMSDILKELKIMNLHLAILTDNDIKNTEVE